MPYDRAATSIFSQVCPTFKQVILFLAEAQLKILNSKLYYRSRIFFFASEPGLGEGVRLALSVCNNSIKI